MLNTARRVWYQISAYGLWKTIQLRSLEVSERFHEWRLGIETSGEVTAGELGFANPECRKYMPSTYHDFIRMIRTIRPHWGQDVFLDLGSGKGRAVIMAACFPFRRIIGVELSHALHEQARGNVERCRRLRCRNISLVNEDAVQYFIPEDVTICYMYNSFNGDVLSAVLDNIRLSLAVAPRRMRLVFQNVTESQRLLAKTAWLNRLAELSSLRGPGYNYVLYEGMAS